MKVLGTQPCQTATSWTSVHGILQARVLEWVAMPSSKVSWPRDQTHIFIGRRVLYPLVPSSLGLPIFVC